MKNAEHEELQQRSLTCHPDILSIHQSIPERSYKANAVFHLCVNSTFSPRRGFATVFFFLITVNLRTSAAAQPVKMYCRGMGCRLLLPFQGLHEGGIGVLIGSNTCQVRLSQLKTQKGRHVDCYDC